VTFDSAGNLWAAFYDGNTVLNLGPPDLNYVFSPFPAIQQGLNGPTRLAIQGGGFLYATNSAGNSITIYNTQVAGYPLVKTISGLHVPLGIAVDSNASIFVAENASSDIAVYNSSGQKLGTKTVDASGHQFTAPGALAISGSYLYVGTQDGSVHAYLIANFLQSLGGCVSIPKLGNSCWPAFDPSEAASYWDGASTGPTGIAFDAKGDVYVSYYYSSDLVKYSPSGILEWSQNGRAHSEVRRAHRKDPRVIFAAPRRTGSTAFTLLCDHFSVS